MPYLIDGHNLVPHVPGLKLSDLDDEQALIERVREFCVRKRVKAEVFFDRAAPGFAGRRKFGPVTAVFVRQGETADTAILRRLHKLGAAARSQIVVSSDRRVVVEAKAKGVEVLSSSNFVDRMESAVFEGGETGDAPALSDQEVDEWLRLFGEDS